MARLFDGRLGRPSLPDGESHPPDRMKRIEQHRVPSHQDIEKMPQRCQRVVLGRRFVGEPVQEPAGQAGSDLAQFQLLILAPSEKPADLVGVGGPGVGIREPGGEELIGREAGRLADPHEVSQEGPLKICFDRRIGVFRGEFLGARKS